eukprot:9247970-Alexandrium_andersonii.AAC.1
MGIAKAEQALVLSGDNAQMEVSEPRAPGPHCACAALPRRAWGVLRCPTVPYGVLEPCGEAR